MSIKKLPVETRVNEFLITYKTAKDAQSVYAQLIDHYDFPDHYAVVVKGRSLELLSKNREHMNDFNLIYNKKEKFVSIAPIAKLNYDASFFRDLYDSHLFSDLTLEIGEGSETKEFRVHKVLLSAVSDYFLSLFTKFKYMDEKVIKLEVDPQIFERLLEMIYGVDRSAVEGVSGLQLLLMIDYFKIKGISIDSYISNMQGSRPTPQELPEYFHLLDQLEILGHGKMLSGHMEALFDDYEDIEGLAAAWEYLPKRLQKKYHSKKSITTI